MDEFTRDLFLMLKADEGIKSQVYTDSLGYKTIGVGFNMDQPNALKIWAEAKIPENFLLVRAKKDKLSEKSIQTLLEITTANAVKDIKKLVPDFNKLTKNQRMALINMMFQMGYNRLSKFKETLKLINAKDFKAARLQARKSLWAQQTPERAIRVTDMFIK